MKSAEDDNIEQEELEEEEIFYHPYMNLMNEAKITNVSTYLNTQPLGSTYMWNPLAEKPEEEFEDVDEFFSRATAELEESIEASIAAIRKEMKNDEKAKRDSGNNDMTDSSKSSCSTAEQNDKMPEKSIEEASKSEAKVAENVNIPKPDDFSEEQDNTSAELWMDSTVKKFEDSSLNEDTSETLLINGNSSSSEIEPNEDAVREGIFKNEKTLVRETSVNDERTPKRVSSLIHEFQQQINSCKEANNLPPKAPTKVVHSNCCSNDGLTNYCSHNINSKVASISNFDNNQPNSLNILTSPYITKANAKIQNKNVWGKIQNYESAFQTQKEMYDNESNITTKKLLNVNLLTTENCYRKENINDFKNKLNDILSLNGKNNPKDAPSSHFETLEEPLCDEDLCSCSSNENVSIDLSEEETPRTTDVSEVFKKLNRIPRSYYLSDSLEGDEKPSNLSIETPEKLQMLLNSRLLSFSFYLKHRDHEFLTLNQNLELDNMIKNSCLNKNFEEGVTMAKDIFLSNLSDSLEKHLHSKDLSLLADENHGNVRTSNAVKSSWCQSIPRACFKNETESGEMRPLFSMDIFSLKLVSETFETHWTRDMNVNRRNDSCSSPKKELFELETGFNVQTPDNLSNKTDMEQKCLLDYFTTEKEL